MTDPSGSQMSALMFVVPTSRPASRTQESMEPQRHEGRKKAKGKSGYSSRIGLIVAFGDKSKAWNADNAEGAECGETCRIAGFSNSGDRVWP